MAILVALFVTSCSNALKITQAGKSDYTIIVSSNADSITLHAANVLQSYLKEISGVNLPIADDSTPAADYEINLGSTNRVKTTPAENDGFRINTDGTKVFITGGSAKGTLYGVYALLEEQLGCRLYAANVKVVPSQANISIPTDLNIIQTPIITFRDVHYTPTNNQEYVDWHHLSHDAKGGNPEWGLWVHTFERLLPTATYWKSHPEYYSLINGQRTTSQLCLSNPAVLEIVCQNLAKEIALRPECKYWSVSSNDNFGYCQCDKCKAMDDMDGSPTGSVIQFVNKVAERFPDKIISTLAYQYSRAAPKVTKPAANVNIMFCNIECNRSKPIATDPSSESFRNDMQQWAQLTDNILVWDYVIQFKNLVSPFPNFHILQSNIQFFVDNSVVALFEQGNRETGGEFADMRSYILSKLVWNPYLNTDSLMTDFCNGYYGKGGTYVKEYIELITAKLQESDRSMGIFGNPMDGYDSYLSPENTALYHALFDKAEAASANQSDALHRVKIARQPLYYAQLEQTKIDPYGPNGIFVKDSTGNWIRKPEYKAMLENFIALCKEEGVSRLSEWHTTPDDYLEMMNALSILRQEGNLSFEKPVTFTIDPSPRYAKGKDLILTNGILGGNDFTVQWLGWDDPKFDVTVDLGAAQPISKISTRFLQQTFDWIFFPRSVTYYTSEDGKSFEKVGFYIYTATSGEKPIGGMEYEVLLPNTKDSRYIRASVEGIGMCPEWHGGNGKGWTFMDEFMVN